MGVETLLDQLWPQILIGLPFFVIGSLMGPAFGKATLAPSEGRADLKHILEFALRLVPRRAARIKQQSSSSNTSDWDRLAIWGVGAFLVIKLYLKFHTEILVTLAMIAVAIIFATALSLVLMSRKEAVANNVRTGATLSALLVAFVVGIVCVSFLWNPPVGDSTLQGMLNEDSPATLTGLLYVGYQVVGAGAFLGLAVFCIAFCIALMAALNLYSGAAGQWLWRIMFRYTSFAWSKWTIFSGVVLAAFAIMFAGGWMFDWVSKLNALSLPSN